MKAKLPKSNIEINGEMWVTNYSTGESKKIEFGSLNKSKSGVYEIVNKLNGKKYIGMARDLEARKRHHWSDLLLGKHKSKEMQDDFNYETGKNIDLDANRIERLVSPDWMFEFNVIIYCYPSQLTFYENLLITHLQPEYNTHKRKLFAPEKLFDELGNEVK